MTDPADIIEALANVVRTELQCSHPLKLVERQESQQPRVRILRSEKSFALSFEQCIEQLSVTQCSSTHLSNWLFPLLKESRKLRHMRSVRRSCDYVIFYPKSNKLWVLLVALKSRSSGKPFEQIANTRLLVDYLLAVALFYSGEDDVQRNRRGIVYRGIVFKNKARPQKWGRHQGITYIKNGDMKDVPLGVAMRRDYHIEKLCCG